MRHQRLQHLLAPEHRQGSRLVLLHEAAVADHASSQDGSQSALGTLFSHPASLLWRESRLARESMGAAGGSLSRPHLAYAFRAGKSGYCNRFPSAKTCVQAMMRTDLRRPVGHNGSALTSASTSAASFASTT